jgi:EmrB/QacA subfamily drug resistance transporter
LGAAIVAVAMAAVEGTIVATAMPTIVRDLGGLRWFSWVFAAYFLTQAVTIPIYGRLADVHGRKKVFFAGVGLFLIGSTLCGFARGMTALIAFRALQGIGAGGVQPIATTIVGDLCTPHERARMNGYMSSAWGVSAVIGPLLGALLLQHWTWSVVFWINIPLGVACILAFALCLHEKVAPRDHRIDYLGALLLTAGVGALMLALVMSDVLRPASLAAIVAAGALVLGALALHERRAPEPIVPLALWRIRAIAVGNGANFAIGMLAMGVTAFIPTYVQSVAGGSALVAGAALGAMSVAWTSASIVAGRALPHLTYRRAAVIGVAVAVLGGAAFALLEPPRGAAWAAFAAALLGLGVGFCNNVFIVATQSSVGWERRGAATASNLFMRQVGQAVGTSLFGAVFNLVALRGASSAAAVGRAAIARGLHDVYILVGIVALALLAVALQMPAGLGLGGDGYAGVARPGSSSGSPA